MTIEQKGMLCKVVFEYKTVIASDDYCPSISSPRFERWLNELGFEGWELVSLKKDVYIFKRSTLRGPTPQQGEW